MISIIIPVLNEEATITSLLEHIIASNKEYSSEIIVVDGGSTDATLAKVNSFKTTAQNSTVKKRCIDRLFPEPCNTIEIRTIQSEKGRAKQMNVGAKNATGTILYFLHADTLPPYHFDVSIYTAFKKNKLAGCFKMKFKSNHWWLKLTGWLTQLNILAARGGDQSLFISKALFFDIGGYNEAYKIYEDNELIKQLYRKNQFTVIRSKSVISSARRYEKNGVWKLQYHFLNIHLKKRMGASPNALYKYYQTHVH